MAKPWLQPALAYAGAWLEWQIASADLPGAVFAVIAEGEVAFERAFGKADALAGIAMRPDHQFRIASHSKTFTSVGMARLVEAGRLRFDDRLGQHVQGLHPDLARATIAQALSHTAGVIRDGTDSGQWTDARPFLSEAELRAALAEAPILPANTRMKYSNHGFGLAGLIIAGAAGEPYGRWIAREVVAASGLEHTFPDAPTPEPERLAAGHGSKMLTGARYRIPGDNPTRALAAATGFISTATETARFFASLDPAAKGSVLGVEMRREITRPQWAVPDTSVRRSYGLGTIQGETGGWRWFGHSGGFQGFLSQTVVLAGRDIAFSVLANAADAAPGLLADGVVRILKRFEEEGAPSARTASWTGRWRNPVWPAIDLVGVGEKVLIASPGLPDPFAEASEIALKTDDEGAIAKGPGFANHGEAVRRVRGADGAVAEVWIGGSRLTTEAVARAEAHERYGA